MSRNQHFRETETSGLLGAVGCEVPAWVTTSLKTTFGRCLSQDDYEHCSTEEEREELRGNLSAASDWLYEQEPTTEKKVWKFVL